MTDAQEELLLGVAVIIERLLQDGLNRGVVGWELRDKFKVAAMKVEAQREVRRSREGL